MKLRGHGPQDEFEDLLGEREPLRGPDAVGSIAALAVGVAVAIGASLLVSRIRVDHPGLVFIAAVVVATALRTQAGVAATVAAAALFALDGGGEGAFDIPLFLAVASALPVLAGRLRRERARLHRSDHRYRMLVEELPVGLYLDLPDTSATNVYSNPEIVRMLGYSPEVWVGDADFFPSILHPLDRDRVLEGLERAIIEGGRFDELYRLRDADGRYRWIVDRGTLIKDERGRPLYVQGVLLDVTAEREAEERAASAQRRYQSLINELPLVTYVEDARDLGETLYISPQVVDFLGYPVERWLDDKDFFFSVLDPLFHDDVHGARSAGQTDTAREYRLIAADGSHRWIDSRRTLVRDPEGRPLYVQGFWVDITERHELEEQLRRQERLDAVGELSAGLAHNFNNMLLAIRGYAELAATRSSIASARGDLAVIVDSADRSSKLVYQLLAFSRRQQMQPRPADLRLITTDLLDLLRPLLGAQIEIRYRASPQPLIACVDRSQIEQVIVNLAVNAKDAMPEGGTLTFGLESADDGDSIVLTVRDTGSGIPATIAGQIFDPFFTTKATGTGLGLASAHGTIEQSGGTIRISETGPTGTTFEIKLPAALASAVAA